MTYVKNEIWALSLIMVVMMAGTAWGFYGVPSVKGMAEADRERLVAGLAGIDAVFVPEEPETMAFFKGRGFRVFLSMNAFGGRGAWKTYPDARPVRADGRLLGEGNDDGGHGGVCPTSAGWRAERLKRLETLASRYLRTGAADGIWLDFIRYPGFWETPSPKIPDTCYCPRCLEKFRKDKGTGLPANLTAPEAAAWIAGHCPYEWMDWKQEQILSFVRECGKIIRDRAPISARENRGSVPNYLGAFVVPWTRGERDGAICFRLGQDPFRLAEVVDVLSPMVYHRMVGREAGWVGEMTAYYKETARCAVWPILQTVDVTAAEVAQAVAAARAGGADGLLAYKFEKGDCAPAADRVCAIRRTLAAFRPQENLIPNPGFAAAPGKGLLSSVGHSNREGRFLSSTVHSGAEGRLLSGLGQGGDPSRPARGGEKIAGNQGGPAADRREILGWRTEAAGEFGARYDCRSSRDLLGRSKKAPGAKAVPRASGKPAPAEAAFDCLGIRAGRLGEGAWVATLPACEPGREYLFTADFYQDLTNTPAYPTVSLWGRRKKLDSHWQGDAFQRLRAYVRCPEGVADPTFRFVNDLPGKEVWMGRPSLVPLEWPLGAAPTPAGFFYPRSFPIGVYGASPEKLAEIKGLAVNTVVVGGSGEALVKTLRECRRLGLRYVLSIPHDPGRLKVYLDDLRQRAPSAGLGPGWEGDLAFYVNDEPELRSVPVNLAEDLQALVKGAFPGAATCMAVVRPARCRDYLRASDFFMMDQYPFPILPMTWLADSLDEAAAVTGRDRLLSVIQAFSEGEVWPELPGWRQIDCLAWLSIVHGSRGIFFYTYGAIGKTERGRRRLGRVIGRLNALYPWLLEKNLAQTPGVEMLSEDRVDPRSRPAVHAALKRRGKETLMIAVNTVGATVKAALSLPGRRDGTAREVFSGVVYPVVAGRLVADFLAHETLGFVLDN